MVPIAGGRHANELIRLGKGDAVVGDLDSRDSAHFVPAGGRHCSSLMTRLLPGSALLLLRLLVELEFENAVVVSGFDALGLGSAGQQDLRVIPAIAFGCNG